MADPAFGTSAETEVNVAGPGTDQFTVAITPGTRTDGMARGVALVWAAAGITGITATYDGNAMTARHNYNPSGSYWIATFDYPIASGSGTSKDVVFTLTGLNTAGSLQAEFIAEVYDNIPQTDYYDTGAAAENAGNDATGAVSQAITSGVDHALICAAAGGDHNTKPTAAENETQSLDLAFWLASQYYVQALAGAKTMTWSGGTATANDWFIAADSYKSTSSGGGPPSSPSRPSTMTILGVT